MIQLSMKVAFLVAITLARKVSELGAMMAGPPCMVFHKEVVSLWLHPKFLPKIESKFHINQTILSYFLPEIPRFFQGDDDVATSGVPWQSTC